MIFSGLGLICTGSALVIQGTFSCDWVQGAAASLLVVISVVLDALGSIKLQCHRLGRDQITA